MRWVLLLLKYVLMGFLMDLGVVNKCFVFCYILVIIFKGIEMLVVLGGMLIFGGDVFVLGLVLFVVIVFMFVILLKFLVIFRRVWLLFCV